MESTSNLIKNLTGAVISTGVALAIGNQNNPALNVVSGMVGSLAYGLFDKVDYNKITKILTNKTDPESLNHDLEKLINLAVQWSIKNIKDLYKRNLINKEQLEELNYFTDNLLQQIKQLETKGLPIPKQIENGDESLLKTLQLDRTNFPMISEEVPYGDFFNKHFGNQLQLCFGELLKNPKCRPAYIAYQRVAKKNIEDNLEHLIQQNNQLLKQAQHSSIEIQLENKFLKQLSEKIVKEWDKDGFENAVQQAYLAHIDELKNNTELLLGNLTVLEKELQEQTGLLQEIKGMVIKLTPDWISRNKSWVVAAMALLVITLFISLTLHYYQPFPLTVRVATNPELRLSSVYPPLSNDTQLRLYLPDQTILREVTALKEIIFPAIASVHKGQTIKIELLDAYWELSTDTIVLANKPIQVFIQPNKSLALVQGRVLSRDGQTLLADASIKVENLSTKTNEAGYFELEIPIEWRKPQYELHIEKKGYETAQVEYRSGANKEIRLNKL